MREINNNISSKVNFNGGIQPIPHSDDDASSQSQAFSPKEEKEINDLSQMPAASLGKSQVAADNIDNDMVLFAKKPELVKQLNEVIEEYAKDHTEEETLNFMDSAISEFFTKK